MYSIDILSILSTDHWLKVHRPQSFTPPPPHAPAKIMNLAHVKSLHPKNKLQSSETPASPWYKVNFRVWTFWVGVCSWEGVPPLQRPGSAVRGRTHHQAPMRYLLLAFAVLFLVSEISASYVGRDGQIGPDKVVQHYGFIIFIFVAMLTFQATSQSTEVSMMGPISSIGCLNREATPARTHWYVY